MRAPRWLWPRSLLAVVVLSGTVAGLAPGEASAEASADASPARERIVVRYRAGSGVHSAGTSAVAPDTYLIEVAESEAASTLTRLRRDPSVVHAAVDQRVFAAADVVPNDPQFANQYALTKIGAPAAWAVTKGSPSILVAVLDTQVDTAHPDLAGKLVPGSDFVTTTCPPGSAAAAHGTVVAGIVGAGTNNGVGIAGIGWETKVMPLRVLCDSGDGRAADVAVAVRYAVDHGAQVVNMSLTGNLGEVLPVLGDAIAYAQSKGAVVVAAAGNQGTATEVYPAAYSGVVAVAATNASDALASFSNRGSWVDLAAPGVAILSSAPGGAYSSNWQGTSFASPYVAGAAALLLAAFPGMAANGVIAQLGRSADRIPGTGSSFASGRLNVGRAVSTVTSGYWVMSTAGDVAPFGAAGAYGALTGTTLSRPIVASAPTPSRKGYWMVATDGGIFAFGDAGFFGSMGGRPLNSPIVGMAPTVTGKGYWLVASDGGMFAFGDAAFYGSMGGRFLNRPIVGMAPTATGKGYWLVASDGGIFAFGDAAFYGSTGGINLVRPVVAMARTSSGKGYWFTASDGGVFSFGDASFYGSTGGINLAAPIVAMSTTITGKGYWFVASDGGVFNFGDALYLGAATGSFRTAVVAVAAAA